jgi:hypothetical protein
VFRWCRPYCLMCPAEDRTRPGTCTSIGTLSGQPSRPLRRFLLTQTGGVAARCTRLPVEWTSKSSKVSMTPVYASPAFQLTAVPQQGQNKSDRPRGRPESTITANVAGLGSNLSIVFHTAVHSRFCFVGGEGRGEGGGGRGNP